MTIEERFEFLNQSIESHDRQLGEITDKLADLTRKQDQLTSTFGALGGMMVQLLDAMKTLAETVTDHERRITGLEGAA
jgi:chromosome segregation ATPase